MTIEAHYYTSGRPESLPLELTKPIAVRPLAPGESFSVTRRLPSSSIEQKLTVISHNNLKLVEGDGKGVGDKRYWGEDINSRIAPLTDTLTGQEVKLVYKADPANKTTK